jgi:hypothetical protein
MRSGEISVATTKITTVANQRCLPVSPRNRRAVDSRSRYVLVGAMAYPRRFPAPWKVEERDECYIVVDGSGQKLAHLYFEDEPIRQGILKRLRKDDAWRIARAITRIPALLRRD